MQMYVVLFLYAWMVIALQLLYKIKLVGQTISWNKDNPKLFKDNIPGGTSHNSALI